MSDQIMWITIIGKLGFDPRIEDEPEEPDNNSWAVVDHEVSVYSRLTNDEVDFLEKRLFLPRALAMIEAKRG